MSRLTILSVGFPLATVGPDAVGGSEQVLSRLDSAIVAAGNRSIVVAPEGSQAAGELVTIPAIKGPVTDEVRRIAWKFQRDAIRSVLEREKVDLVHMHGADFCAYIPDQDVPVLATLHLPPAWYPAEVFRLKRPRTWLNCVSASQQRACPPCPMLLGEIENGVPIPDRSEKRARRRFALALGRVCPEKNLHVALDAGARAGFPVLLGGRVFPYQTHMEYFQTQVAPRLDRRRRFAGPINSRAKRRLLSTARCLLVPSLAPETSSLVAMEAMACGTPVIAFPSGALKEIVQDGVTGFIVKDEYEMAHAIEAAGDLNPDHCRQAARDRFSADAMIEKYFDVHHWIASPAPGRNPRPARSSVKIELIDDTASLEQCRAEWSELYQNVPCATPFQSPAWLVAWWRHLGEGELFTLACRDCSGRLVGLIPMYIYNKPDSGKREMFLLGTGNTDYLDGLFLPGFERQATAATMRFLHESSTRRDACDWQQLRPGSPLLLAPLPAGYRQQLVEAEPCPSLALPRHTTGIEQIVPAKMAHNLRYYRRRAERLGRLEMIEASEQNLPESFDQLVMLHRKRWQARGGTGMLDEPRIEAMHRHTVGALLSDGMLRLLRLKLDGRTIAALYGLMDRAPGGRFYYYLGGFDPDWADLSPGLLLIGGAIELAWRQGAEAFDFLRGREAYKYLWGATDRVTYRHRFERTPP